MQLLKRLESKPTGLFVTHVFDKNPARALHERGEDSRLKTICKALHTTVPCCGAKGVNAGMK